MLATTGKIRHVIAHPRTTSLRCGMGHGDCAAQYPFCLSDNRFLNVPAVAFRLRVEHQEVSHALPSPIVISVSLLRHCRPGTGDSQLGTASAACRAAADDRPWPGIFGP